MLFVYRAINDEERLSKEVCFKEGCALWTLSTDHDVKWKVTIRTRGAIDTSTRKTYTFFVEISEQG